VDFLLVREGYPLSSVFLNYTTNLLRLLVNDQLLRPLIVAYAVTTHCNLNCVYCEDFGARRNAEQPAPLSLPDAQYVLRIIRQATNALLITGGEPLLYPHLADLLAYARHTLRFRHLTVLTNAVLLSEYLHILPLVDRLMVSVDATTPDVWDQTIRATPGTAQTILDNVAAIAPRQQTDNFRMVLNCVITPETLSQVERVLDFCIKHDVLFSLSPQSVNNWPRYELLVSSDYRDFITRIIEHKQQGAPILGSMAYLRMLLDFEPYACYPLLVPRVMADGGLAYPCRPIEREGDQHGGRAVNLLEVSSWNDVLQHAVQAYDNPPSTCGSCFQQCYIESSLMQARPWALLGEWLRFAPSRQGCIHTYAPG
jgi:MoaA/NifB/PqqE/SkfB family radical SAM enzyme